MIRLTREQVREIDRRSIEEYHIPGIVLMENAARGVTDLCLRLLKEVETPRVTILCGGGNNGGDGLAVARHLHNAKIETDIQLLADPAKYRGDALTNFNIVKTMGLPISPCKDDLIRPGGPNLVVDAIFGTGLTQPPREPLDNVVSELFVARLVAGISIVSIDLPSGLDCDEGTPLGKTIQASHTVTFVAEKAGFANPTSKQYTGEVIVADIGCPRELIYNQAR